MTDPSPLPERIARAYDAELFQDLGKQWAALLGGHLRKVLAGDSPVLNWAEPAKSMQRAESFLHEEPVKLNAGELRRRFAELVTAMLSSAQNLHSPRYIGHQVPPPAPLAGLFDAVGSVTNQVMAIYEMGPWSTAVELALVNELGQRIGWPSGQFAGFITHGGSLANLTALLTARNVALGDAWENGLVGKTPAPVILAHQEAHYCIARAAGVLGLGARQVIRVGLDDRRRMDPVRLDQQLKKLRGEGTPVIAVAACACATPIGAFDPLEEIAAVCQKHGVWLHVDAAHGGGVLFSDKHRHLVRGLEQADSVVWDAHKMLFVPALCAFVFYKNAAHRFETFRQEAPYLFDPSQPGLADFDLGLQTIECTKRAAAFGLWGLWSMFGPELFGDLIDTTFARARELYELLRDADDFEPLHEPQGNILAFRYLPRELRDASAETISQFQRRIRWELIRSGEFYIVQTQLDGVGSLRVTVINPLTTSEHLRQLLDALRAKASGLRELSEPG